MVTKVLITIASIATIIFGLWHFTVPTVWKWYDYIDPSATELVLAVRATNVFFSLSLVLFGIANLIFLYVIGHRPSIIAMLAISSTLWLVRCIMQVVYPQGTMNMALQYGMLTSFALIFTCYLVSLFRYIFVTQ